MAESVRLWRHLVRVHSDCTVDVTVFSFFNDVCSLLCLICEYEHSELWYEYEIVSSLTRSSSIERSERDASLCFTFSALGSNIDSIYNPHPLLLR